MKKNKSKNKGTYWENKCARYLNQAFLKSGFEFRRVPLSGSAGKHHKHLEGDIYIVDPSRGSIYDNAVEIECKRRESLRKDCLAKGNSVVDNWIMDLCNATDKRKDSNRGRTDWALLIQTSKKTGLKYDIEFTNEFVLMPDNRVGQHHADLPWIGYPKNRLACNTYSWAPLRDFLKIKDGYKYFLYEPEETRSREG